MSNTNSHGTPIEGAVALVTGGNRGFGRAMVQELLDRGAAKVYATSRSPQRRRPTIASSRSCSTSPTTTPWPRPPGPQTTSRSSSTTPAYSCARRSSKRHSTTSAPSSRPTCSESSASREHSHPPSAATHAARWSTCCRFCRGWRSAAATRSPKAAAWSATNSMRVKLREQGTTVTALHVAYMDTDMTAGLDVPKADPREVARQTADAIIAGEFEILADDTTRTVKSQLSGDLTALYAQLAA